MRNPANQELFLCFVLVQEAFEFFNLNSKLLSKLKRLKPPSFYIPIDGHNVDPQLIGKILSRVKLLVVHISKVYFTILYITS